MFTFKITHENFLFPCRILMSPERNRTFQVFNVIFCFRNQPSVEHFDKFLPQDDHLSWVQSGSQKLVQISVHLTVNKYINISRYALSMDYS